MEGKGLTRMEAIEIAETLAPAAKDLFPGSETWLFGSTAKGYANESSDIDVCVLVEDYPAEWTAREICRRKLLLQRKAERIDARIETCVRTCRDSSGFVQNAVFDNGVFVA